MIWIDHFSVLAAVGAIAGPALLAGGFKDLRLKRLIQNTPTSRIRSAAMGLVEVNGVIECRSLVSAPFTGRLCAAWNVDISIQGRQKTWSVVHRATSGHPFFLRDDTGVALVFPHGADCRVHFGVEETCPGIALPECYASYVGTLGAQRHLWRLSMLRFRERVLEEGQRVYVMGTATPPATALVVSEGEGMAATGTGEWRAARVRGGDQQVAAVIRRGESEKTFIISQDSERDLTTGLGLQVFCKLVGGPLIGLLGLGYWIYAIASGAVSH
jgi:hypothetical protein